MAKNNVDAFKPILNKAGSSLAKFGKATLYLFKNPDFYKGAAVVAIPAIIEIRRLKKRAKEKESLLAKAIAKQDSLIKVLDTESEISRERQDCLLAYDTQLKKEIKSLQLEIQSLYDKIAELEKNKDKDE